MASRKFRFVSPGVFLKEIDKSQLPGIPDGVGPVIIGRTIKGPSLTPYKVRSMDEFERVFGGTSPGLPGEDPWREGTDLLAESYAPYAAKAYLSADIDSPVTIVRLAGVAGDDAAGDIPDAHPGWATANSYGLVLFPSASGIDPTVSRNVTGTLAAIFYGDSSFTASLYADTSLMMNHHTEKTPTGAVNGKLVKEDANGNFKIRLQNTAGARTKDVVFSPESIRPGFNTNPVKTNSKISEDTDNGLADLYWLGETFEEKVREMKANLGTGDKLSAMIVELDPQMSDHQSMDHGLIAARTGWFIAQDTSGASTGIVHANAEKLFRVLATQEGFQASRNLMISIERISIPRLDDQNQAIAGVFGTFSLIVNEIIGGKLVEVERFDNLDLNPSSDNYIAKKIGTQYYRWDPREKRNKIYGTHPRNSEYIRVEMHALLEERPPSDPSLVPFGFLGPIVPDDVEASITATGVVTGSVFTNNWIHNGNLELGALTANASSKLRIQWPTLPLVNSGSLSDGNMMGASPFKQAWYSNSRHSANTILNPGYVDYLRRAPVWQTLSADQESGLAQEHSKYSYVFTLDDVVLHPVPGGDVAGNVANIETAGDVLLVEYIEDSRNGTPGSNAEAAKIEITLTTEAIGHSEGFTITVPEAIGGEAGNPVKILFGNGVGNGNADLIRIRRDASGVAATPENLAALLQFAINGTDPDAQQRPSGGGAFASADIGPATSGNGRSGVDGITATRSGATVTITADTAGIAGNNITLTDSDGDPIATIAGSSPANLSGGADADKSYAKSVADTASMKTLRPLLEVVDGFRAPMVGGSEGVSIIEADPFNNRVLKGEHANATTDATTRKNYAYASVDRAIELVRDAEMVEHNLAVMPGITVPGLTTKLIRDCESRADSLAIIDLPDVYVPPFEKECENFEARMPSAGKPEKAAKSLSDRQLNSSYGATYYPWVKIKDEVYNRDVWVPPSVVALGVMAFTEERDEVWFAPAGFNRGGLNEGNAGLPVLQVTNQLMSKDRDTLYAANINPIASFVSEGIVIFGQKTLQSTQSALDRINVRRLLIFVKKRVSQVSKDLLFEQNVRATWNKFLAQVNPFLESVKTRFGLSDYKVVLDSTTTTPDLVDRNILYAKVLLKPARAIEFIAVDFVITNTGASFED